MNRMVFGQRWLAWMESCVFTSSMSVLINGCPTEDFQVGRGLRQGDPLSPFLFLIAAEGLTGLARNAVDLGEFKEFKVAENVNFHILQFADDTILVGEGTWENLWSIKSILRGFELVSGLRVNFFKSKLYGINLEERFMQAASSFLPCCIDSVPFKFLGIPVGSNPRRCSTWKPVIENLQKRLSNWKESICLWGVGWYC